MGWGRETPMPTLVLINFLLWFGILNCIVLRSSDEFQDSFLIHDNFKRQLNDYWSVDPTRRGLQDVRTLDDVRQLIANVFIPKFLNYNSSSSNTPLVNNYAQYGWPGVMLRDNTYTRLGDIYLQQSLLESPFSGNYRKHSYTYTNRSGGTAVQSYVGANGFDTVGDYEVSYGGYYWNWPPDTEMKTAVDDVNWLLGNSSGWSDESVTEMIRVYMLILNDKYVFQADLSFVFTQFGSIFSEADTTVFVSLNNIEFWIFMIVGFIHLSWMLWEMISLRSLWYKDLCRWTDVLTSLVFLISFFTILEIESNVDLLQINDFSKWDNLSVNADDIINPTLQFPEHPNLSRILVANYLSSMMWIWRVCVGILVFIGYMKLVHIISPTFPLITYPMDVVAAGGTTSFVFCMTVSMVMLGFVQMFVSEYYLYVSDLMDFLSGLQFLFLNLVGDTDTTVFNLKIVSSKGNGKIMLAVFLFIMVYIFFTMFIAIIATNYRNVYRKIEATPMFDKQPIKQRLVRTFCEYPRLCKALGPIGMIRYYLVGHGAEEEAAAAEEATRPRAAEDHHHEEESGDLKITAVEELSEIELERREIETGFFGRFEGLQANMRDLETHFEQIMAKMELLDRLEPLVDGIQQQQKELDEALGLHFHHVNQEIRGHQAKQAASPKPKPRFTSPRQLGSQSSSRAHRMLFKRDGGASVGGVPTMGTSSDLEFKKDHGAN